MSGGNNDKKSFWNTLPGILTAIAAIITAIGGLLVILDEDDTQVELPKIEQFDSDPAKINPGEASQLRWGVSGATQTTIEPRIGNVAFTGTKHVFPSKTTTYTLVAENEAGSVEATVEVLVEPEEKVPTIGYFELDPAGICVGENTTLNWTVSGATEVAIEPRIGNVASTGTRRVSPDETTTYTLIAENEAGNVEATVEVLVELPSPDLILIGTEDHTTSSGNFTRYKLSVTNWNAYPPELFQAAPDLPPCGLNTESSRTWVDIYDLRGDRIYGFCALGSPSNLQNLWFAVKKGETSPQGVYVVLKDRRRNQDYISNRVTI